MTAEVYLNGRKLARHAGGYSTFRVELSPALQEGGNLLAVLVDNSENDTVYPQKGRLHLLRRVVPACASDHRARRALCA